MTFRSEQPSERRLLDVDSLAVFQRALASARAGQLPSVQVTEAMGFELLEKVEVLRADVLTLCPELCELGGTVALRHRRQWLALVRPEWKHTEAGTFPSPFSFLRHLGVSSSPRITVGLRVLHSWVVRPVVLNDTGTVSLPYSEDV